MKAIVELVKSGGPVMIPMILLSVVLYSRCCELLWSLHRTRRELEKNSGGAKKTPSEIRAAKSALQETFYRQRFPIAAMITAAPLLGLLGTVTGMMGTFESLAQWGGRKSMEGLARGISEVLICTESGLAVAIPAVMALYYAHRLLQKRLQRLVILESARLQEL